MNSKLKCTYCKKRQPAHTMLVSGMYKFCDRNCKVAYHEKRRKHDAKTASRRLKKTPAEDKHLSRVASLGCIACKKLGRGYVPAEVHHIRAGQGLSQRASNFATIPLCEVHHRTGADAIHQSKVNFEAKFGTEKQLLRETIEALAAQKAEA